MIRAAGWRGSTLGLSQECSTSQSVASGFHATRLKSFRFGRCGRSFANLSADEAGPENDCSARSELFPNDRRKHASHARTAALMILKIDLTSFDSGVLKSVTVTGQLRALVSLFHPAPLHSPSRHAALARSPLPRRGILIMPGDNDRARVTNPLIGRQIAVCCFLARGTSVSIDRTEIDRGGTLNRNERIHDFPRE